MVGLILFAIVMTALLGIWSSLWKDNVKSSNLASAQMGAKEIVFKLAEAFRDATYCTASDSGCTVGAPIQSASASSCTVYSRDASNALVQTTYSVDGSGNFNMTSGGQTWVLSTGASMTLTYYSSTTYNTTSLTSYAPTSTTAYQLIAVQISVTVTQGNIADTYTTLVRLNNGPGTAP
jgi:hypothetical protein